MNPAAASVLAVVLYGCGNAIENLSMDEWKPAGSAAVPKNPKSPARPRLTLLQDGQGREIKAGSLVHASVKLKQTSPLHEQKLPDVWFWLGDQSRIPGHVAYKWRELIDLGDEELRAAFLGLRAGSRVSVTLEGTPYAPAAGLPTQGFSFNGDSAGVYSGYGGGPAPVRFGVGHTAKYEFMIVDVCAGRLYYRTGTLKQFGYIPHLWAESPDRPFAREGVLEWVAIEGDCDSPNDLRVEMGPAYRVLSGTLVPVLQRDYRTAPPRGKMQSGN